jgi:hypothetical protein
VLLLEYMLPLPRGADSSKVSNARRDGRQTGGRLKGEKEEGGKRGRKGKEEHIFFVKNKN